MNFLAVIESQILYLLAQRYIHDLQKIVHLRQFIGGVICQLIEDIRKGYLFPQKWYVKG